MPIITASIDPVTRIEGHLKVDVEIDTVDGVQQVVDAHCVGTLFRGFEKIMEGRDPRDAPNITSRICGVCPTSHGMAAALTLDNAFGVTPPTAGIMMRNLVHGACFLESDILHFYILSLLDYIKGPAMAPWQPGWDTGRRLDSATESRLVGSYLKAIEIRRKCHEMGAIYGGKLPHTPSFIAGGFTAVSTAQNKTDFQTLLTEIIAFIEETYIPDVELLGALYPDYYNIGKGYGNLMSYGVFQEGAGTLFAPGLVNDGSEAIQALDIGQVTEQVTHSWYDDATNDKHPSVGDTVPQHPKAEGYSWLKAPRYSGTNYECGPLARMRVNGDYAGGVSVMDRHMARSQEAFKIASAMQVWLDAVEVGAYGYSPAAVPTAEKSGVGLTEAPRGALGHWLTVKEEKVAAYQVVTPTCWNCSPRDTVGNRGPMEEALIGVPVKKADQPVEVLRLIHSFDPCLDCATHVMRPDRKGKVYIVDRTGVREADA
ncbi:nickel-dependent hydrogenase large subunit [Pontiella sulfatireligans]|uniref:Periplasmic [NiFeSe] hydrogenase large subunit n=1 Tax=Pontiella sulfatireligans TaxID=2750658 RepID=A0A6C2UQQ1_9BACT|nr:nickel-dependent hydrogenase large subunit [Pontiella sulfatireligans]VGO22620.1 Periplasmic [NiFeSe] hydrogenase large subunit [Pontiella sulfatireligans]